MPPWYRYRCLSRRWIVTSPNLPLRCGWMEPSPRCGSRVHRRRLRARHTGGRNDGIWTHDLACGFFSRINI